MPNPSTKPRANERDDSRDPSRDALTPSEAAARLGVTADAVRVRLRRGTLPGEKLDGEWFVHLPREPIRETSRETSRAPSHEASRLPDVDLLAVLAAKDETISAHAVALDRADAEVAYLRSELSARSRELAAERERSDVLHREAFAHIEALTAGLTTMVDNDQAPARDPVLDTPQAHDVAPSATEAATPSDVYTGPVKASRSVFGDWWARLRGL